MKGHDIAAVQAVQAGNARAEKDFADEFARLGNLPIDDFDLDTRAGELGEEDAPFVRWAKARHRRGGAAHVFISARYETGTL